MRRAGAGCEPTGPRRRGGARAGFADTGRGQAADRECVLWR